MKIIPLYRFENLFLVGLKTDFQDEKIHDGLVIEIDLKRRKIKNSPWSGQKMLKFGYYYPISKSEISSTYELIISEMGEEFIDEIERKLLFPSKEAIESLIWIPERLKKMKPESTNKDSLSEKDNHKK